MAARIGSMEGIWVSAVTGIRLLIRESAFDGLLAAAPVLPISDADSLESNFRFPKPIRNVSGYPGSGRNVSISLALPSGVNSRSAGAVLAAIDFGEFPGQSDLVAKEPSPEDTVFLCRSDDQGRTFTEPVPMAGPTASGRAFVGCGCGTKCPPASHRPPPAPFSVP
jgi:hypothetical protein